MSTSTSTKYAEREYCKCAHLRDEPTNTWVRLRVRVLAHNSYLWQLRVLTFAAIGYTHTHKHRFIFVFVFNLSLNANKALGLHSKSKAIRILTLECSVAHRLRPQRMPLKLPTLYLVLANKYTPSKPKTGHVRYYLITACMLEKTWLNIC